ncbi:USP domain-containing protein [Mycena venus]|uniref:USP domain-containing protein n=1 Tax=Mycena venus TaxID=2733690 RepID=A0A8H6Z3N5_9AGAR|nr:USP domain-containing protein [Mycena venus]
MLGTVSLLLIPLLSGANAANDWGIACKGECSYDIPDTVVSGTLKISGASNAVSDITAAGGWTILSCDASSLAQDIRLVCQSSDCEHLFEGHGAIDTLIRLPETCGSSAFARVANIQVDPNQTLPADIKATISPAGNITTTVFIMSVDTNFAAIDSTKTGPVSFSLEGYNFPVQIITPPPTKRDARGLKTRNWMAFNESNTYDLPPLNIDDTFPLLSTSIDCDHFSASVSASFETKVDVTVSLGLIATGTVIPPVIDEFAVFAGLDASVVGTLDLTASALGTISTGETTLYSVALPGVDFPGFFSLEPIFAIYGGIKATLNADFDLKVDLAYNLNTRAHYPPDTEPSTGDSKPATSTLVFSAVPNLSLNSEVKPLLKPEIKLGLEAFGVATATVSLDVESRLEATLNINADGNAQAGTTCSDASGEIEACVDIKAALSVNVVAEGSIDILGISASNSTTYALYSDGWDLYNKCASASGNTKREAAPVSAGIQRRAGITCPTSSTITSIEEIINEIIQDIQSIGSS